MLTFFDLCSAVCMSAWYLLSLGNDSYFGYVPLKEMPWVKGPIPRFQYSSAGALDLGGASTQITFIPEEGTVIPEGYNHTVKLYGEDYNVYTHSFLCYGVVQMLNSIHAALIKVK